MSGFVVYRSSSPSRRSPRSRSLIGSMQPVLRAQRCRSRAGRGPPRYPWSSAFPREPSTGPCSSWERATGTTADPCLVRRGCAPGEGPGGWGDARPTGCPASLSPSHPPLVIILKQAREDLDGDGFFDLFEDLNHNQILDPGEDRDGDGRLTPPFVNTPFGSFRGCEGATREDQDCDGHLDLYYEDKNHNGILDPGEDRNGNGILDTYDPVNLPYIHPYIEDRNNNGFLDDRVRPLPDDQEFQVTTGPNGEQIRTPISPNYPYGSFRPAAGGIVLASVA